MLLWEEYARGNALAYKYTSFCVKYRDWARTLKRSMRQVHVAGEKLFVDYAGQTVPITDPATGEVSPARIVATDHGLLPPAPRQSAINAMTPVPMMLSAAVSVIVCA